MRINNKSNVLKYKVTAELSYSHFFKYKVTAELVIRSPTIFKTKNVPPGPLQFAPFKLIKIKVGQETSDQDTFPKGSAVEYRSVRYQWFAQSANDRIGNMGDDKGFPETGTNIASRPQMRHSDSSGAICYHAIRTVVLRILNI